MDGSRFDQLTRLAVSSWSRRSVIGAALGLLATRLPGNHVEAATKRANGQICRKGGDCDSNFCGPKDKSGRRYCQCETECLMLDGSPGVCTGGPCTCSNCDSELCNVCAQNVEGRFFCGVIFLLTADEVTSFDASVSGSLGGNTSIAELDGANGQFSSEEISCTSSAECPSFDVCPALYIGPFCIGSPGQGGACAIALECGPISACVG